MHSPRYPQGHPDRFLDCEETLESFFLAVMDLAIEAGWTLEESAVAMNSLSDHYMLKLLAMDQTTKQLVAAKMRRN
jgi:hypothetical protein